MALISRGKNRWELQVSLSPTMKQRDDGTFKKVYPKKSKIFLGSKSAAKRELIKFEAEVRGSTGSKLTVAEIVNMYRDDVFKKIKRGELKKSAEQSMHAALYKHIVPALGAIKIQALTADDIQKFIDSMIDDYKAKTIRNIASVLNSVLKFARMDLKLISDDLMSQVRLPKARRSEVEYYNAEETDIIVEKIMLLSPDDPYKSAFLLCLLGGLRRGECAGINIDDVNFETCEIKIQREREIIVKQGIVEDTPKTAAGYRIIVYSREVIDVIKELLEHQDEMRKKFGRRWIESGALLKCTETAIAAGAVPGSPLSPAAISKQWKRFTKKNNIPHKSLHKLRHTHASLIKDMQGVNDTTMQQHMGHADVSVTHAVYSHAFRNKDDEIANEISKRYFEGKNDENDKK